MGRFARRIASLSACVAVLGAEGAASASPSARLTYVRGSGAESCPDEAALRSAVASRLGYDPFFPAANKSVVAEVSRADKGYRGRVVISDEKGVSRGERVFPPSGQDCAETVRAMALAISIAVDDLSAESPAPEETKPEEPTPTPTSTSTSTSTSTPTSTPTSTSTSAPATAAAGSAPNGASTVTSTPPLEVRVFAGPHLELGLAPSLAVGGRLGAELLFSRFSVGLEGRLDAPASDSIPSGGRVVTQLAGGALVACVRGAIPFACATGALTSFTGRGEDVTEPRASSALLAIAGVRVGAELPIGALFAVRAFAGAEVPLARHEVQVDGITHFRLPIVAGLIGADGVLRFR